MLTTEEREEIQQQVTQYPFARAACIEALKALQRTRGWIDDATLAEVARMLDMSVAELDSVATFYNLIYRQPVGRHIILLCDSVSCWIVGFHPLHEALRQRLGIDFGQTTPDERFTLLPIACLGVCEKAPAMMIDEDLHAPVEIAKLDEILAQYE